ncbi:MAG: hypothetical protein ACI9MC_000620 [Kiritimatiellia bacterium]|jgi:hypothetical protein
MRTTGLLLIALTACGSDPCPTPTSPTTATFEAGAINEGALLLVKLANSCEADVLIQSASLVDDAYFTIDHSPDVIPALDEGTVALEFLPDNYQSRLTELQVQTDAGTVGIVLIGQASPDQDDDGVNAIAAGGLDCDDNNPAVGAPAPETFDGQDNDCDGIIDEGFIVTGDVIITEIMLSPAAVSVDKGQWVELRNMSGHIVDLSGWTLSGTAGTVTIPSGVRLKADEMAVVGFEQDTALNGGVELDGVLTGDDGPWPSQGFHLSLLIDGLPVSVIAGQRWPEKSGNSIGLDALFNENLDATGPSTWCTNISTQLSGGDHGTPGATNDHCPQFDHDGDGISFDEGDCDDTTRTIGPDEVEIWDGVDRNCDGLVDQLIIGQAPAGQLSGTNRSGLGAEFMIDDWDEDGKLDMMVLALSNSSRIYRVDPAEFVTESVMMADVGSGSVQISGSSEGTLTGIGPAVDIDGDKDLDLVVFGRSARFYRSGTNYNYAWVYDHIPASSEDNYTHDDALITLLDPLDGVGGAATQALFDLDMNGDGSAQLLFGNGSFKGNTEDGAVQRGTVWILDLHETAGDVTFSDVATSTWRGTTEQTAAGEMLAGGDVDGDGYDDLILTDRTAEAETTRRIQVIGGSKELAETGSFEELAILTITGLARPRENAEVVGSPLLVDVDGDETLDLVVPDPWGQGVLLYWDIATAGSDLATTDADLRIRGPGAFGAELSWGDLRGDSEMELLIGAPAHTTGPSWAYLFEQASLVGTEPLDDLNSSASFRSNRSTNLGAALMLADLDNDGADEVILGDRSDGGGGSVIVFKPGF